MYSLLFDTSTERGIVAIYEKSALLVSQFLPYGYQNSHQLISFIEKCLLEAQLNFSQLSFLSVGIGPGSYTGIRLSAIAAKSMVFVHDFPLVPFCSLDGFVPDEAETYLAAIDAKIGGVYLKTGIRQGERIDFTSQAVVLPLPEALPFFVQSQVVVTPQVNPLRSRLEALHPLPNLVWQEKGPDPVSLGRLCWEKYQKNEISKGDELELLYLRRTQAEIEKGKGPA